MDVQTQHRPSQTPFDGERRRLLRYAHSGAWALNLVALAVAAWALIGPAPSPAAMASLALLPIIALAVVAVSHGAVQMLRLGSLQEMMSSTSVAFLAGAIVIPLRARDDLNIVEPFPRLAIAAAVSCLIFVAMLAARDRTIRDRGGILLLCGALAAAYGFGVAAEANSLLDRSAPQRIPALLLSKSTPIGRYAAGYSVRLVVQGPAQTIVSANVPAELYHALRPGSRICIMLYQGALGMPWFSVDACG